MFSPSGRGARRSSRTPGGGLTTARVRKVSTVEQPVEPAALLAPERPCLAMRFRSIRWGATGAFRVMSAGFRWTPRRWPAEPRPAPGRAMRARPWRSRRGRPRRPAGPTDRRRTGRLTAGRSLYRAVPAPDAQLRRRELGLALRPTRRGTPMQGGALRPCGSQRSRSHLPSAMLALRPSAGTSGPPGLNPYVRRRSSKSAANAASVRTNSSMTLARVRSCMALR